MAKAILSAAKSAEKSACRTICTLLNCSDAAGAFSALGLSREELTEDTEFFSGRASGIVEDSVRGVYGGDWADGYREGLGVCEWEDGDWAYGDWHDDEPCGTVEFHWANGIIYVGRFSDGAPNGRGEMLRGGDLQCGTFSDGAMSGNDCEYYWHSGQIYRGSWQSNAPSGRGEMIYSCGDRIECEWENGSPCGEVAYVWAADGRRYVGDWSGGAPCGQGEMNYQNGDRYVGEWQKGLQHGIGVMTYANGDEYRGGWSQGVRDGEGEYRLFGAARLYRATFVSGAPLHGVMTTADGLKYEGAFRADGLPEGQGTLYGEGGAVLYCGNWSGGNPAP